MNPPCLDRDPNFCNPVRLYFYHVSDGMSLGFQWGCIAEGIIAYYVEWGKSKGLAEFYLGDSEPLDQRCGVWGCDFASENKKNDDASNEAKEAECYTKRYPKVIPKYCKDNDATKCDLEQLKKHNERHEKN
eukprot:1061247-Ditylum_brightwellii.AAC.1